jgi:hypothetical protein
MRARFLACLLAVAAALLLLGCSSGTGSPPPGGDGPVAQSDHAVLDGAAGSDAAPSPDHAKTSPEAAPHKDLGKDSAKTKDGFHPTPDHHLVADSHHPSAEAHFPDAFHPAPDTFHPAPDTFHPAPDTFHSDHAVLADKSVPLPDASTGIKLVITEIMVDPNATSDPLGEYIEVYNAGTISVNLKGWSIGDNYATHVIAPPTGSLTISPGQYLVLAYSLTAGGVPVDYSYGGSGIALANTTDGINLIEPSGAIHDNVVYSTTGSTAWNIVAGQSISLKDPSLDNSIASNWCLEMTAWAGSAGDKGTPGKAAGCLTKLVISEIMADPKATADPVGEWFEIYNAGGTSVNLNGWSIADNNATHIIAPATGTLVIAPGKYVVLAHTATAGGVPVDYTYGSSIQLANGSDEISLIEPSGTVHDKVVYSTSAAQPWTIPAGASISLKAPSLDNNDPTSWCAETTLWSGSAGDFGTPGSPPICK